MNKHQAMSGDAVPPAPAKAPCTEPWEYGSVVSYPKRWNACGDPKYRGNCDGRLLLSLLRRYRPKHVADPMAGSGTTKDVIDWANRRLKPEQQMKFWSGDLRRGFDLLRNRLPTKFDFVFLHPPYWNIIRYSDHPSDLSACEHYNDFKHRLEVCLSRCADALVTGGRLAVLVGDVRRRGAYYPIVRDVMNLEGRLGSLRSVIVKLQHNCTSDKRKYRFEDAPIRHEYCLVFKR